MTFQHTGFLRSTLFVVLMLAPSLSLAVFQQAQSDPLLASDYPERYTVVKGDTLWDIAAKFLTNPWRWPEVWQGNPQVENPDLIYPGDVLVMTFLDGRPVLRSLRANRQTATLSPEVRVQRYDEAIPIIDPASIDAYLNSPLVTNKQELNNAGYVVEGIEGRLLLGKYDHFYARAVPDDNAVSYQVFRPGRHFVDPVTNESLGWEAVHVGDANMIRNGDPARMSLLDTYLDVSIRDRLRPIYKKTALPFFFPKAPNNDRIRGVILATPNRSTELGNLSVVAINLGSREDIEPGDVFRIKSQRVKRTDPVTRQAYFIPEENAGLLMVFRVFEKVSYGLVTNTTRSIRPGDNVVSPYLKNLDAINIDDFE